MIWGRLCHAMPCLSEQRNNETKRASLVLGNDSLPVHSFAGDVGCLCMFSQKLTQSLGIVSSQSPCFLTGAQGHDWANSGLHGMAACFLPSRVLCTIFSAILFGNLCAAALSLCFVLSAIGFAALFCYSICLLQGVVSFLVCFFSFFFSFWTSFDLLQVHWFSWLYSHALLYFSTALIAILVSCFYGSPVLRFPLQPLQCFHAFLRASFELC